MGGAFVESVCPGVELVKRLARDAEVRGLSVQSDRDSSKSRGHPAPGPPDCTHRGGRSGAAGGPQMPSDASIGPHEAPQSWQPQVVVLKLGRTRAKPARTSCQHWRAGSRLLRQPEEGSR